MKIILLVENSIHEVTYPAGSELEVADFEGEFLISKQRAKRMEEEKTPSRLPQIKSNLGEGKKKAKKCEGG